MPLVRKPLPHQRPRPIPGEFGRYYVESKSTPGENYIVDVLAQEELADFSIATGTCPCKGWQVRKDCSHLLASKALHMAASILAERFHELYEELAPACGYATRPESARPWADLPQQNKTLMVAVCARILNEHASMTP